MRKSIFILLSVFMIFTNSMAQDTPPSPVPDDLLPYTIAGLREREYDGGSIEILTVLEETPDFTQYYISYSSDDLSITGVMNIPPGEAQFPVVILLHGYYDRETYWSGMGTWQSASYFARSGFITIAPDFRSWGESDAGLNLFATGLTVDTLNLISSIRSLEQADSENIFLWGHSMGGGVATKALVIDSRIDAAVLYAPNSANDADLIARWGAACVEGQSQLSGDNCNPAEILLQDSPISLRNAYFTAAYDIDMMQAIAPIYHLENMSAPVQIHIGTADGESLAQTPPQWSETLYLALLEAEQDVSYFVYEDQGHFFTGEAWVRMMQRSVDFFNLHRNDN